jgi:hypothetical protein
MPLALSVAWPGAFPQLTGSGPAGLRGRRDHSLHTFRMDRNAYRDDGRGGADQPDAYWRRRVITLALGLGLLGALAWAFSGGGAKPAQPGSSGTLPADALGTAVPSLSSGVARSGTGSSAATGSSTRTGSSAGTGSPAGAGPSALSSVPAISPSSSGFGFVARGTPRPSASAAPTAAPGRRCPPGAVVLSLFTDRTSYGPSQYPRFVVYAVSTSQGSCAFDPGQMQIVVLSSGRVVWDSADCYHGGNRTTYLTRGVPTEASVTWNRAITLPGCQVLASSARAGGYTVQARTATMESPARTFKLTG